MAKVEGYQDRGVAVGPICGVAMQDRPGPAQGNWFVNREVGGFTDISKELALAHHPVHRNSGAISVGGTIMDMGVWVFMEEKEGLVKRGFDQVVPDGQIYCYQGAISSESGQGPPMFPGRLLISLTSETEMVVDRQDGECVGELDFVNPTTYYR
ncbi:MAG TPA: hypothetical protein EYM38_06450 [Dehalococcoidia bacterium]|nr:hypothetical protein [Dehalococcoidia bacterium]